MLNPAMQHPLPALPPSAHSQLRSSLRSLDRSLQDLGNSTARPISNRHGYGCDPSHPSLSSLQKNRSHTSRLSWWTCERFPPSRSFSRSTSRIACTSHIAWGKITARLLVILPSSTCVADDWEPRIKLRRVERWPSGWRQRFVKPIQPFSQNPSKHAQSRSSLSKFILSRLLALPQVSPRFPDNSTTLFTTLSRLKMRMRWLDY